LRRAKGLYGEARNVSAERELKAAARRATRASAEMAAARVGLEAAMKEARREGMTLAAIAEIAGISRQRVAQIVERGG
jgi:DNA-directed RNA polymerase sigma subunit (sigma70/sigma32)